MTDPDLQTLWQSQQSEETAMPIDEIRGKANAFQRRIRTRNLIEYVAGVVVVATFGWQAYADENLLIRIGSAAIVVGAVVALWQLHVRGGAGRPPEAPAAALMEFQRAELARQRDALASVPLWYLGPFVPGMAITLFARWRQGAAQGHAVDAAVLIAIVVAVFVGAWLLNRYGAKKLQKQIDKLDAMRRG